MTGKRLHLHVKCAEKCRKNQVNAGDVRLQFD